MSFLPLLLPRYRNLKMLQFWQDFGKFWLENADVNKNSAGKTWYLIIFEN